MVMGALMSTAVAAQLRIFCHLRWGQDSSDRQMIFQMGFAQRSLRRGNGRGERLQAFRPDRAALRV